MTSTMAVVMRPPLALGRVARPTDILRSAPARRSSRSREVPEPVQPEVDPATFFAVDIRSAVVVDVEEFPEARKPAWKLRLDLGELGERVSSAQITSYAKDELVGSTVVCVVNFPP